MKPYIAEEDVMPSHLIFGLDEQEIAKHNFRNRNSKRDRKKSRKNKKKEPEMSELGPLELIFGRYGIIARILEVLFDFKPMKLLLKCIQIMFSYVFSLVQSTPTIFSENELAEVSGTSKCFQAQNQHFDHVQHQDARRLISKRRKYIFKKRPDFREMRLQELRAKERRTEQFWQNSNMKRPSALDNYLLDHMGEEQDFQNKEFCLQIQESGQPYELCFFDWMSKIKSASKSGDFGKIERWFKRINPQVVLSERAYNDLALQVEQNLDFRNRRFHRFGHLGDMGGLTPDGMGDPFMKLDVLMGDDRIPGFVMHDQEEKEEQVLVATRYHLCDDESQEHMKFKFPVKPPKVKNQED